VEVKSLAAIAPIHEAQLLTYMRLGGLKVGLLMNFNEVVLKHGIRRRVLTLRNELAVKYGGYPRQRPERN
jgi:hypothetical protein